MSDSTTRKSRQRGTELVIASNRGPVQYSMAADGTTTVHHGTGGLIAVLGPALAAQEGTWVAAAIGDTDRVVAARAEERGELQRIELPQGPVWLRSLVLDGDRYAAYYNRISNQILWFLHHQLFDLARGPCFDAAFRADWQAYLHVNEQVAMACDEEAAPGARVLLQDYHLAAAPAYLRARRDDLAIAHFTQICWADADYFAVLPRDLRHRLVDGMLGADLLGFLVPRWARNFLRCCADLGHDVDDTDWSVTAPDGRAVSVRTFPVGVDADDLCTRAREPESMAERDALVALIGNCRLVVRIERMELSKNIVRGLAAYELLLERDPELHGRIAHYVLAYSSRDSLPEYQQYAVEVHEAAGRINARFGSRAWTPVIVETQNNLARAFASMVMADMFVVNPVRDGMNLVAKEGPAVNERDAVLILSRNAGAADDLDGGALLIDPFDIVELADAMATALTMPADERARRAERLRQGASALPPRKWLDKAVHELGQARRQR